MEGWRMPILVPKLEGNTTQRSCLTADHTTQADVNLKVLRTGASVGRHPRLNVVCPGTAARTNPRSTCRCRCRRFPKWSGRPGCEEAAHGLFHQLVVCLRLRSWPRGSQKGAWLRTLSTWRHQLRSVETEDARELESTSEATCPPAVFFQQMLVSKLQIQKTCQNLVCIRQGTCSSVKERQC